MVCRLSEFQWNSLSIYVSLRLCKNVILSHHVCIVFLSKQPIAIFLQTRCWSQGWITSKTSLLVVWARIQYTRGAIGSHSCINLDNNIDNELYRVYKKKYTLSKKFSKIIRARNFTVILYHSLSFPVIPYHSLSFPVILYHSPSFPIIPCHYISFTVILYHSPSFSIIIRHSLSFPVILCHSLSFPIISRHSLSFPVILYNSLSFSIIHCHSISASNRRIRRQNG
jgi:hypothetical protein